MTRLVRAHTPLCEKNIILHVGLPKTASTFLQTRVFAALDQREICYNPERVIACIIRSKKRGYSGASLLELRHCIAEELRQISQPRVLLSYEQLCGNPWNGFSAFQEMTDFLSGLFPQATVILVLRRQDDWLLSLYKETLAMLHPVPPWRFFSSGGARGMPNVWHYDFAGMHQHYRATFGAPRVHLLFFEELKLNPGAFIERLLRILGVTRPGITRPGNLERQVERRGLSALASLLLLIALWSPSYLLQRRLAGKDFAGMPFQRVLRTQPAAAILLCALQRLCTRINATLALPERLRRGLDRRAYIDWPLISRRRRRAILRHYQAGNRQLAPYMPDDAVRALWLCGPPC